MSAGSSSMRMSHPGGTVPSICNVRPVLGWTNSIEAHPCLGVEAHDRSGDRANLHVGHPPNHTDSQRYNYDNPHQYENNRILDRFGHMLWLLAH